MTEHIQLPEPDGYAWERLCSNAKGVYWDDPANYGIDVTHPEYSWQGIYTAATVRRLIAEAVAAEREACAMVCDSLWRIDGQFTADEFAAEVRARAGAPKAAESCVAGLLNVIAEDTQK